MKAIESKSDGTLSYAALLEKVEILRSTLRWAQTLDRSQIQKILGYCNALREEVLRLSHTERFVRATGGSPRNQSVAQRRKALLDREFQFEGVFGDSPRLIEALEIAEKAAPTDLPVLIDGESGTARSRGRGDPHANSSRAAGAAPSRSTAGRCRREPGRVGAVRTRARRLHRRIASRGPLERPRRHVFLDEIGELPRLQASCCAFWRRGVPARRRDRRLRRRAHRRGHEPKLNRWSPPIRSARISTIDSMSFRSSRSRPSASGARKHRPGCSTTSRSHAREARRRGRPPERSADAGAPAS